MEDEVQSDAEFLAQGHAGGGHCAAGGLTVAYKAQNAAAIAAVLAIVAMMVTALVRGDHLYMMLGSAACCLVALVKIIAWYAYDKTM